MFGETMEAPHTCFSNAIILGFLLLNLVLGRVIGADTYNRDDFPADFVFGSGTSAYQVQPEFLYIFASHFIVFLLLFCYVAITEIRTVVTIFSSVYLVCPLLLAY